MSTLRARIMAVTQPTAEPLSDDDVKAQIRLTHNEDDYYLTQLIAGAREAFRIAHEHTVMKMEWQLTLDQFPLAIELKRPPVISVLSIKYTDPDGVEQTVPPEDYQLLSMSKLDYQIIPVTGKQWPSTCPVDNAVRIHYEAGYATASAVPEAIKQWMKDLITHRYMYPEDHEGIKLREKPTGITSEFNSSVPL